MGDNLFELCFSNQRIVLPKRDITFTNGLGIVNAYGCFIFNGRTIDIPLIGVVDTSFSPILELIPKELVVKLNIIQNGFICIIKENSEYVNSDTVVYHYSVQDGVVDFYQLDASSYEVLNSTTLKLVLKESTKYLYGLYNTSTKIATSYFDKLGPFTYNALKGVKVAEATAFINDGENILNSVTCLLDEYGNTVSSYKEANTGREFEASMELIDIMGELTGTSR